MKWARLAFEGLLVVALVGTVLYANDAAHQSKIPFLPRLTIENLESGVFVQGTWAREDGDNAWPSQTTTIRCERSTRRCFEATAILADGDQLMPVSIDFLQVLRWEDDRITLKGSGGLCVDEVYDINLTTKTGTGLQTRKPNCPNASVGGPAEVRLRLIDGYKESADRRFKRKK